MRPATRTAIVCTLLFGGTLLLYSRTAGFGFINLDDPVYVTENPMVRAGLSWAGVVWAFTAPSDYWHPLAWLSHMLDCQLYGLSAGGHHMTSVIWHALNAVLVFFVFRRLTGGAWRSAFAAALFAWHPLRVESVAWIAERKDVMSGFFFLLTILAYARYAAARSAGRPALRAYLLTLAGFAAGLMSKPMVVTLPCVLLLLDYWPLARQPPWPVRRLVFEKLPFFALSGAAAVATVLMQKSSGAFVLSLPLGARLENAVVSLARYVGKFVWPFDLIVCYRHPDWWPAGAVLASAALVLGLAALAWWQRRNRPWIATGLAWFLVTLLPVLGIVQVGLQAMADRYTYLPMLGIELALVPCLPALATRPWRIAGTCAALVLLGACALRTWNQEGDWRNSEALFRHALRVDRNNDVAEGSLASALFAAGRFHDAEVHALRGRALDPQNFLVLVVLGNISEHQGQIDRSMALYRSALGLRPDDGPVRCQLGLLEMGRGHLGRARALMIPALRSARLRGRTLQLGRNALRDGDAATALFLDNLVLAVVPDDPGANAAAGLALFARHNPAEAVVRLRIAARSGKAPPEAEFALAECEHALGRTADAEAALARVEAGARDNPALLSQTADLYALMQDFASAIRIYRRVVALDPSDSRAHAALGYLLIHSGDRSGGLAQWRRALQIDPDFPGLRERLRQWEQ
ncbi:MAG: tetratricopeptide repeat protein [Opitutaceae bacterium]